MLDRLLSSNTLTCTNQSVWEPRARTNLLSSNGYFFFSLKWISISRYHVTHNVLPYCLLITTPHYTLPLQQDREWKAESERKQCKGEPFLIQSIASCRCRIWSNDLGLLLLLPLGLYQENYMPVGQQRKERSEPKWNNKSFRSKNRVRANNICYHWHWKNNKVYHSFWWTTHWLFTFAFFLIFALWGIDCWSHKPWMSVTRAN